jgi:hypothetical protein
MTPFQRGKALKQAFERRREPSPDPGRAPATETPASPFARMWRFRQKEAETRRLENGTELTGRFTEDRLNGCGLMLFPDGRRYEGDFREGRLHGHGTMRYPSGAVYSGHFRDNRRHGLGTMTFANGFRYEGHFRANRCHGHGSLYFPDGTEYNGQFERGRFNGRGVLVFPDGSRYEGGFREDRRHGRGIMTFPNGFNYQGLFADNRPHGHGRMTYPGGTRYEGQLRAGKCHGFGELIYPDGTRYEGQFRKGRYHGHGRLTYPDGTVYEGAFENDRRHGRGTVTRPDKAAQEGHFVNGNRLSDHPFGKHPADRLAAAAPNPEGNDPLLEMDLSDCRLREDEPEKETERGPQTPGPPSVNRSSLRHRTSDGHYVTSKEEIIVDNWLYMTGLRHVHRKRLPVAEEIYATFYLPEGRVCLEYQRENEGAEENERKRRIFEDNHFNLIEIRDEDFQNLDDVLSEKLLSCGIRPL